MTDLIAHEFRLAWATAQAWNIRARIAQPDAAPVFVDALSAVHTTRSRFDVWPTLGYVAAWSVSQGTLRDAALIIGHLDAHAMSTLIGTRVRATMPDAMARPELDEERTTGASLTRDALVTELVARLRSA